MNRAQRQFGEPSQFIRDKLQTRLNAMMIEFIQAAPFAVMATANDRGECDASPRGGQPGFVQVLDESRLLLPDMAGNRLFQSCENLETNAHAGLVFFVPGCGMTLRVNGRATVLPPGSAELEMLHAQVFDPDDRARALQGLLIEIEEAYLHCGRSLRFSRLWDTGQIRQNAATRSDSYWARRWTSAAGKT
ncbi:MAG: pyridoxamine 5'-phosphate oxidase family protein [Gammaproteobacteria bacterium]|nr:pyridoxamine 5'-phosphate oxidase family protein [Gammaproteobacteria bacterium]